MKGITVGVRTIGVTVGLDGAGVSDDEGPTAMVVGRSWIGVAVGESAAGTVVDRIVGLEEGLGPTNPGA